MSCCWSLLSPKKAITKVALRLLFNQQANRTPVNIIPDQNNFETGLGIIWSYKKSSKRHPKLHINKETELTIRIQPRIPFQCFEGNVFSRDFQIVIMFIAFLKNIKIKKSHYNNANGSSLAYVSCKSLLKINFSRYLI